MSLSRSEAERKRLLPGSFGTGFRRLARHALGGGLVLAAVVGWLSLATWSIHDPSLNNATRQAPVNMFGYWGATLADLTIQLLGLAAIVLFLPLVAWGWHMMADRMPDRARTRLIGWPVSVMLLAGGLSVLPVPKTWPLHGGFGGILGDLTMACVRFIAGLLPDIVASVMGGGLLLAAGAAGMLFACGVTPAALLRALAGDDEEEEEEEEEEDDAFEEDDRGERDAEAAEEAFSRRLGAAEHWLMSAPAMLMRLLGRRRGPVLRDDGEDDGGVDVDIEEMPARAARRMGAGPSPDEEGRIEPFFEDGAVGPEPDHISEQDAAGAAQAKRYRITPRADQMDSVPVPAPQVPVVSTYALPPLRLLKRPVSARGGPGLSHDALQDNARLLEDVLADFGVKGEIINVRPGPVVTLYELEPAPGTKSSRVIGLADDIARSMSAAAARVAVVPGRNAIGIELPNARRELVCLRELLEADAFQETEAGLALALGKNIGGEPVIVDLSRMPHLLIAGTTGSGKSVGINTMILSLLYRYPPDECKFIMIDPKMLELSVYDGIPHLLSPVVTDPKKAVVALKWTVREMEERYKRMSKLGVRNIDGYNERVIEAMERGEVLTRTVQTGFDRATGQAVYEEEQMDYQPMPYIVVIVDEMADLMMVAGKDIEGAIQRLAQMARAAGIHLIMATQRPSVDVITGTIKANFPTRVSFQVTSRIDSRTILGEQGAEQLVGQGDMLYMAGGGRITRVHGPFVSDEEVEKIVRYLKRQGAPEYLDSITDEDALDDGGPGGEDPGASGDDLYDQAVAVVLRDGKASTSYVQRRLSIGYNRAATLIERMEEEGVIGPANHAGKREILVGADA